MRIYIAGPYTKGDTAQNVHDAISAGDYVARLGHTPFIPHLTHFWHMIIPHTYDFWMAQDEKWLEVCEGFLRLDGESAGADKEENRARELGLTIYKYAFEIPPVDRDHISCDWNTSEEDEAWKYLGEKAKRENTG